MFMIGFTIRFRVWISHRVSFSSGIGVGVRVRGCLGLG